MDARAANDRLADVAERLRFVSRVPMLCECSDSACKSLIMIGLDDYRTIRRERDVFLTLPEHELESGEPVERRDGYWLQARPAEQQAGQRNGTR